MCFVSIPRIYVERNEDMKDTQKASGNIKRYTYIKIRFYSIDF